MRFDNLLLIFEAKKKQYFGSHILYIPYCCSPLAPRARLPHSESFPSLLLCINEFSIEFPQNNWQTECARPYFFIWLSVPDPIFYLCSDYVWNWRKQLYMPLITDLNSILQPVVFALWCPTCRLLQSGPIGVVWDTVRTVKLNSTALFKRFTPPHGQSLDKEVPWIPWIGILCIYSNNLPWFNFSSLSDLFKLVLFLIWICR